MFAKIKSSNFIDALQFELVNNTDSSLKGILKDEEGCICCRMERELRGNQKQFQWTGLNDLPYGKYILELSHGEEEMKVNLVKRV